MMILDLTVPVALSIILTLVALLGYFKITERKQ